jgi:hypothetical protein
MKTKIRNFVLFVSILLLILFAADFLFGTMIRKNPNSKISWAFQKQNTAYDVTVLGSSRAFQCIDVPTFTQVLGNNSTGINLGVLGASYEESFMIFKHFLDNKNSTKILLVQVDIEGLDEKEFKSLRIANFLPYIGEPTVFHVLKDRFGKRAYILKYVPFFKYAEFNEEIGPKRIIESLVARPSFTDTGTRLIDRKLDCGNELARKTPQSYSISSARESYLRAIVKLAQQNNIETCLIMAPYFAHACRLQTNRNDIIAHYKSIASEYQISFVTWDDNEKICSDPNYFSDCEHVNKQGAILFTRFLAEQHKKNTKIALNP